jgi:hypothetical protein
MGCNSFVRRIMPLSPLNRRIWKEFRAKLVILKDRRGRGTLY